MEAEAHLYALAVQCNWYIWLWRRIERTCWYWEREAVLVYDLVSPDATPLDKCLKEPRDTYTDEEHL